jgi:Flp pilus assembly pilin Flp
MHDLIRKIIEKFEGQEGQALAEFTLILAFVAAICIVALTALAGVISVPFDDFIDGLQGGSP